MVILSRFKVSGHSMMPTLIPNQQILVSSLPFLIFKPEVGDIVAFKDEGKFIVKRVKKVVGGSLQVLGDNKKDSKEYGWIKKERILGKVIHIFA